MTGLKYHFDPDALPRRFYGTYWPLSFYSSEPEPERFVGVASVPGGPFKGFTQAEIEELLEALHRWQPKGR